MWRHLLLAGAYALSLSLSAEAALITFTFEGTVHEVPSELREAFHAGDLVMGSISFESETPQTEEVFPGSPNVGAYRDAIRVLTVKIGSYNGGSESSAGAGIVVVSNDQRWGDTFVAHSPFTGPKVGGFSSGLRLHSNAFTFELVDPSGTALDGDALPSTMPATFGEFPSSRMQLFFSDGVQIQSITMAVTKVRSELLSSDTPRKQN
jgi:hypothetical protein